MGRFRSYLLLALCSLLLYSRMAGAQPEAVEALGGQDRPWARGASAGDQAAARASFARANALMKDALFAKAVAAYGEALLRWEHPAIYYNLAIAQLNLAQPIAAYESLGTAMKHGPEPLGDDKYEQARNYRRLLESQLGRLEVICDMPGAQVTWNGETLFIGPGRYTGIVRTGGHQLVASKRGHMPDTRQAVLGPGDSARVTLRPRTLSLERRWAVWKPWIAVGAGSAMVMTAGFLDWSSSRGFDDFEHKFIRTCGIGGCRDSELNDALLGELRSAEIQQWTALFSYAVGGATLIAGGVMVYMNRGKLVADEASPVDASLVLIPLVSPAGAGVAATIRFW